jgi:amino acid permease
LELNWWALGWIFFVFLFWWNVAEFIQELSNPKGKSGWAAWYGMCATWDIYLLIVLFNDAFGLSILEAVTSGFTGK